MSDQARSDKPGSGGHKPPRIPPHVPGNPPGDAGPRGSSARWRWYGDRWVLRTVLCQWPDGTFAPHNIPLPRVKWDDGPGLFDELDAA